MMRWRRDGYGPLVTLVLAVLAVAFFVFVLSGCSSSGSGGFSLFNPASWFGGGSGGSDPTTHNSHGEHAAENLLKPLAWTGTLIVLAGVVWLLIARDFKLLIVGVLIAAAPAIVMLVWKWAFLPVAIAVGLLGVASVAWIAANLWMRMKAKRRATRLRNLADNGGLTDSERAIAHVEANVLDYVGPRFKVKAPFNHGTKELPA